MPRHFDRRERDRAVRMVRTGTVAGAGAAIGLAGLFSTAAAMTFSGKSAPATSAPAQAAHIAVPSEPAPQQSAAPTPDIVQHVIHRTPPQETIVVQAAGATGASGASGATGGVVAKSPLRQPVYSAPVASGGSAPAPAPVAGRAPAPVPPVAAPPPPPPPPPPPRAGRRTAATAPSASPRVRVDTQQAVLTSAAFTAIGTTVTVVVEEPDALEPALAIVREQIAAIDRACSRFRADSELMALNRRAGTGPVVVSPLLEEAILVALATARMTTGLVDPTVGGHLVDIGYTVTFRDIPVDGPPLSVRVRAIPDWKSVEHDPVAHTVQLPAGVTLDLGSSGKAWAADRCAAMVAQTLGVGVAVDCGGDVAIAGEPPVDGWRIRVTEDVDADSWQDVQMFDGGLATSGTGARRWRRGGEDVHHIIDPATGRPALTPWRMVSVAAASCVEANAASTASVIMGDRAVGWLDGLRLPARLVDSEGQVRCAGGWGSDQ